MSYLDALLRPEQAEGVKIPDEIGYPTGTFQLTYQNMLNMSTGDSIAIAFQPIVGLDGFLSPIYTFKGVSAGSLSLVSTHDWKARDAITNMYSVFRPVSAVMEISYSGNTGDDQGRLCVGCTYPGPSTANNSSQGWEEWAQMPDMEIWPSKNGARVVWKPLDNSCFEFADGAGPSKANLGDTLPYLCCALTNLKIPSGTGGGQSPFMVTIVCNFEAVPKTSTADLVDTEPSPWDVDSLKRAFAWAQEQGNNMRPLVGVVGQAIEYGKTAYAAYQGARGLGLLTNGKSKPTHAAFAHFEKLALKMDESRRNATNSSENNNDAKSVSGPSYRYAQESMSAPGGPPLASTRSVERIESPRIPGRY